MKEIHVECYEGMRADERPRKVTIEGATYTIARVLEQSVTEDHTTRKRSHRYRVVLEDGRVIDLVRDAYGVWYVREGAGNGGANAI